MHARLISVTQPLGEMSALTPEQLIVYTARVSNPANQNNHDTGPRLLQYLVEHRHWSPFEMVDLTVEVETSRAIAAQILRHAFRVQEFSQRYADASTLGFESCVARRQDPWNRQNSTDDLAGPSVAWFDRAQADVQERAQELYQEALSRGVAKEQARMLLPLSVTTRMYLKNSVRGWIHYLQARTAPSTQREHRDVALACLEIFREQFPTVAEAVFS